MKARSSVRGALVATLLASACVSGVAAGPLLPEELAELAQEKACVPIDDFLARPGMIDPPYVYGVFPGEREDSAAFWCKKAAKSDKPFLLMFKDARAVSACPTVIEWWNYPGGLSVETQKIALSAFRSAKDGKAKAPAITVPNARLIVSSYDGVSDHFYCHQGQWWVRSAH